MTSSIDSCQETAKNSEENVVVFCASVVVKMATCVKIKVNEKVMRFNPFTLIVGNVAICCEEEGEIIIPTAETG